MASTSFLSTNFTNLLDIKRSQYSVLHPLRGISKHEVGRPFPKNGSLQYLWTSFKAPPFNKRSKKDFAVHSIPPETGVIFPFWPSTENSWITWLVGLMAIVPVVVQRLLLLTKEVEITAETVERVAGAVENVAEDVEKLAEDVAEKLPEGSKLKKVVVFVENASKEIAKDAQLAEDFLDKVEEVDQQVESLITNVSKASVKLAANDEN